MREERAAKEGDSPPQVALSVNSDGFYATSEVKSYAFTVKTYYIEREMCIVELFLSLCSFGTASFRWGFLDYRPAQPKNGVGMFGGSPVPDIEGEAAAARG